MTDNAGSLVSTSAGYTDFAVVARLTPRCRQHLRAGVVGFQCSTLRRPEGLVDAILAFIAARRSYCRTFTRYGH